MCKQQASVSVRADAADHVMTALNVHVQVHRSMEMTYVKPPRPMAVKKLMAKRVFLGLSRGKRPSKNIDSVLQTSIKLYKLCG